MTSKELIRRVAGYNAAPRIGWDFMNGGSDFGSVGRKILDNPDADYSAWGVYPELLAQTPGFHGEVRRENGSILGRLNGRTKGECIHAALQDGWESYDAYWETYLKPAMDPKNIGYLPPEHPDRFQIAGVTALQATIRDARRIDNMLMDTILEPEALSRFISACADIACAQTEAAAKAGADCVMMWDDWGMQNSLYINLKAFQALWKPAYARVAEKAHSLGLLYFLHSCGYVADAVPDFLECGVDAFQFDQPSIYDFDCLSSQLKGRAALYSPVDIQKYLPTGDRAKIEGEARRMLHMFWQCGGGLIAKDYPGYGDIGVRPEWASWAQEIFQKEGLA